MALVHEMLYQSPDLVAVDFGAYAEALSNELLTTYRPHNDSVRMRFQLQPVRMSIDMAIPCGLILGELISNAFKHAFPNGQPGEITVTVDMADHATCVVSVADDGIGVASEIPGDASPSLGLRLIPLLARQVHGSFTLDAGHPGTEARLHFPLEGPVQDAVVGTACRVPEMHPGRQQVSACV
jgi:two-component sensor histidine kinase